MQPCLPMTSRAYDGAKQDKSGWFCGSGHPDCLFISDDGAHRWGQKRGSLGDNAQYEILVNLALVIAF